MHTMDLLFPIVRMPSFVRTIGLTIACAVVILVANASIYANTPQAKHATHQEARQPGSVVRIVMYQNS